MIYVDVLRIWVARSEYKKNIKKIKKKKNRTEQSSPHHYRRSWNQQDVAMKSRRKYTAYCSCYSKKKRKGRKDAPCTTTASALKKYSPFSNPKPEHCSPFLKSVYPTT